MTTPDKNNAGGISERAIRIARMIDRLPPGTYSIELLKPEIRAASWKVEIERLEFIQKAALSHSTNGLDTE